MTVSTTISKSGPYNSGTTGPFSYAFYITDEDELRVILTSAAGVETDLTLTTDYTVAGVGEAAGGTVTLVEAPDFAGGELLTLKRAVPQVQETEIRNQGAFYPAVHEAVFDRLQMQIQDLTEEVDRAVKVDVSASDTPDELLAAITAAAAEATAAAAIVEPLADDLATVADMETEIRSVEANETNINAAVANATNINAAVANATNINAVVANADNINTVAGDTIPINTVAGDAAAINMVAGLSTPISTLAPLDTEITALGSGDALAGLAAIGALGAVSDGIPIQIGFSTTQTGVNAEARDYYSFKVSRPFRVVGSSAGVLTGGTAPTGADLTFYCKKNGTDAFSTNPKIADGATTQTAGTVKSDGTQNFAADDECRIGVGQVGSTAPGQKILFSLTIYLM
jgi:hypothetical protein